MKVLTLTTQYANNMGALLQCHALSRYLRENEEVECKVLQYYPNNAMRSWSYFPAPRSFRDFVKNIYCLMNLKLLSAKIRKNKIMRKFIKDFIPLTESRYNQASIKKNPPIADAFICGSDQIWNFKYRCDLTYFFDFVDKDKSKIIAYAPSIADPWTPGIASFIAPYLHRFDALSVREIQNLDQVRSLSPNNNPTVVCDPVFLLSKEQWKDIADYKFCPEEPYIFCYFLSVYPLAIEAVKKMREVTGLKVVHFNLNALDKFNSDYDIRTGSPNDFIGLISKATYVCTNSFHCSAFSIIYKRHFNFIAKNMANERILNLVDSFGLSDVFMTKEKLQNLSEDDLKVDFSKADSLGQDFIKYSKDYLHNALYK